MSFWRGRRVFVTGHTGFKGAWLSLWLHDLGARVTGYALPPPTRPNLFELAGLDKIVDHIEGDVQDGPAVARAVARAEPEVIFHLAAQPLVRLSYEQPVETYGTNVMGTVHLLEAARRARSLRSVVCVTSDKCYHNTGAGRPFREDDPMGGEDPYSSSKGCSELVVSAYRQSFFPVSRLAEHGVGLASVRAGNVIGGGDWARDRLVPDVVAALLEARAPILRNPDSVRPWQHVLEPLRGYMLVAERLHGGDGTVAEGWNFGPAEADAMTVSEVVDQLVAAWGRETPWRSADGVHPHEAATLRLDCAKASRRLAWAPRLRLGEALRLTAEWYKAQAAGEDVRAITLEQIRGFAALVEAPEPHDLDRAPVPVV